MGLGGISVIIFVTEIDGSSKKIHQISWDYCKEIHNMEKCSSYLQLSIGEQGRAVFKSKFSYTCLNSIGKKHTVKNCKEKRECAKFYGEITQHHLMV